MLLGFGELNLHACTIEFECKVASISNALLIYHTRTARCPYVAILGRHFPFAHQLSPQDSHTLKNMYGFFTFACENPGHWYSSASMRMWYWRTRRLERLPKENFKCRFNVIKSGVLGPGQPQTLLHFQFQFLIGACTCGCLIRALSLGIGFGFGVMRLTWAAGEVKE